MHLHSYLLTFNPFSPHTINPIVKTPGSSHCSRNLARQQTIPFLFQEGTADWMKLSLLAGSLWKDGADHPCSHLLQNTVAKLLWSILRQLGEVLLGGKQSKAGCYASRGTIWVDSCSACWVIERGRTWSGLSWRKLFWRLAVCSFHF